MMVKQAIAVGSLLAGGTALSVATYLNMRPPSPEATRSFEGDEPRINLPVPTPAYVEVPEPAPLEILPVQALKPEPRQLPEPRTRVKPRVKAQPTTTNTNTELVPCSEWREVGAAIIQEGGAVGSRTVRMLCAAPKR